MQTAQFRSGVLIYNTQVLRVSGGHMTGRCQGLFPPATIFEGKSPGNEVAKSLG